MRAYQNILLIDDDQDDTEFFMTAMELVSDEVRCTALNNAKDALNRLTRRDLETDLIFLDLNMPVMSGQQFLTELKKDDKLKEIPVIVLSTTSHKGTVEKTIEMGAQNFFTKPDNFNDLVSILKSVID
ncbi:MAG: response regulator [Sphingobacteriales bacterium]|nr:MAG: response regulator [Sphingobacteriales bacterium]